MKKSKETLKTYFETGDKPTQEQYVNLIDSYVDAKQLPGKANRRFVIDEMGEVNVASEVKLPEYTLSEIVGNKLSLLKDGVVVKEIDLTSYLDDTNLSRLVSGTVDANGLATFTRDDKSKFTVDLSNLKDNIIEYKEGSNIFIDHTNPLNPIINISNEFVNQVQNIETILGSKLDMKGDGSQLENIQMLSPIATTDIDVIPNDKTTVSIIKSDTVGSPFLPPPFGTKEGLIMTFGAGSFGALQIASENDGNREEYLIRKYNTNNGATSFKKLWHSGNFNPSDCVRGSDFVTGTFTPTLLDTGGGAVYNFSSQVGKYIRYKNIVHFYIKLLVSSQTGEATGLTRIINITPYVGEKLGSIELHRISGTSLTDLEIALISPHIFGNKISLTSKVNGGEPIINFSDVGRIEITGTYYTSSIN